MEILKIKRRTILPTLLTLVAWTAIVVSAQVSPSHGSAKAHDDHPTTTGPVYLHAVHATNLNCSTCHVPVKTGSVELRRPRHAQCMTCHRDSFEKNANERFCSVCHSAYPVKSKDDLFQFPRFQGQRAVVFEFSHAKHVDQKARINPATGFRADCTFCHTFKETGEFADFPKHQQCAGCHANAGAKPLLSAASTSADCRGCHQPEEIENPGFTKNRRLIADHVASGQYANLKFNHAAHFKSKEAYKLDCTTCHSSIPRSTSLSDLTLPKMIDCVGCHDTSKTITANLRMSNCGACHKDEVSGVAPATHQRNVKPAFHTPSFRLHHEEQASEPGNKCFACHQNVSPSAKGRDQCIACHQVMKPSSHTARWKDDLHGQFAAIDRDTCTTCHTVDSCSRCHNEVPRSHLPLALFKGGTHMRLAMLNERSCFTCHTFQNTCSKCHTQNFKK